MGYKMKKLFSTNGSMVGIIKMNPETVNEKLYPRIYSVGYNDMVGFYLNIIKDKFDVPEIIFGNYDRRAKKVINTYDSRDTSTGILLTGNKGSGKSMLAELISNNAIDKGIPVVMVSEEYFGDNFISFIADLGECVLFFDEFSKVYSEHQASLLTLLDGTMSSKRLIMFTDNDVYKINEFMLNRPGRIFYHFKYCKLDEDFITEYCNYCNVPEIITDLKYIRSTALEFSVDVLLAIVEEYKRYGGKVDDIVTDMNIDIGNANKTRLHIEKIERNSDKADINPEAVKESIFEVDLNSQRYDFDIRIRNHKKYTNTSNMKANTVETAVDGGDYDYTCMYRKHLVYENFTHMVFSNDEYTIKFRKEITSPTFNWNAF